MSAKLTRSRTDKYLAGVCGGLGAYFKVDSNIVRIVAVLAVVFLQGMGVALYAALWLILPYGEDGPTGIDQLKKQFGR